MKMRKSLSVILSIVLTATMMLAFAACGGKSADSEYEGTYIAIEGEIAGLTVDKDSLEDYNYSLVINDDETATLCALGKDFECSWKADDTSITLTNDGTDIVGTIDEDIVTFDDLLGSGAKIIFAKEGSDAAEAESSSSVE